MAKVRSTLPHPTPSHQSLALTRSLDSPRSPPAYDLTEFAPDHPGGSAILLKYAGKVASEAYDPIHPPGTLEQYLPKDKHLGKVDMSGVEVEVKEQTQEDKDRQQRIADKPPLSVGRTCSSSFVSLEKRLMADSGADEQGPDLVVVRL